MSSCWPSSIRAGSTSGLPAPVGAWLCRPGRQDLAPGNLPVFGDQGASHFGQVDIALAIGAKLLLHFVEPRFRFGRNAELDAAKHRGKVLVVALRPLVERMLVALGALQANAQEGVGECFGHLLGLARVALHPEVRHRGQGRELLARVVAIAAIHRAAIFVVVAAGVAAGAQDDAAHDLVVGPIFGHCAGKSRHTTARPNAGRRTALP